MRLIGIIFSLLLLATVIAGTWAIVVFVPGAGLITLCLLGFYAFWGFPLLVMALGLLGVSIFGRE